MREAKSVWAAHPQEMRIKHSSPPSPEEVAIATKELLSAKSEINGKGDGEYQRC